MQDLGDDQDVIATKQADSPDQVTSGDHDDTGVLELGTTNKQQSQHLPSSTERY